MNIIKFPSNLQIFGKNVNFQNNCRVNSEICVYKISVLFHTFFFMFGKVIDSQSFKYKEYSVNGAKLF